MKRLVAPPQASKVCAILLGSAGEVAPIDIVGLALHGIQQEPAWPSIMDGHQPEDWPNCEPPPDRGHHLVYLHSQGWLTHANMLAIRSFYLFMLVSLT